MKRIFVLILVVLLISACTFSLKKASLGKDGDINIEGVEGSISDPNKM